MARGLQNHQARQQQLARLGTPLSRRSRSRCELCTGSGVPLRPTEILPLAEEPDFDRCILVCDRCSTGIGSGRVEPREWRFLEEAAWSEIAAVQVTAVRLLRTLTGEVSWAATLLDSLYLSGEVEELLAG